MRPIRGSLSSATQTMMSLYFGPKVHVDYSLMLVNLQKITPDIIKKEEERLEKVKQAKKDQKERKRGKKGR